MYAMILFNSLELGDFFLIRDIFLKLEKGRTFHKSPELLQ